MQAAPHYENLEHEVFLFLAEKVKRLHDMGVADIVLDPGFGFGKTLAHNYELMAHLEDFREFDFPLLVGVSRKPKIYNLVVVGPADAPNGTTVLNTVALLKGAHILRVHDVKPAVEAVAIVRAIKEGIGHTINP